MGKLILVSGENNSGKSVFSENLIAKCNDKRCYIATMVPKTKENYARIEKHKKQREGLGFLELELPYQLGEASAAEDSAVLLEDVSNLLANNIFEKNIGANEVFDDIINLKKKCRTLVVVTISGIENLGYDEGTAKYIDQLDKINKKLYDAADVSIKMTDKKPIYEKGDEDDIF